MTKPVANLVFHLVVIALLAVALYFSLGWPRETALFPQAIGIPILGLCVVSFGLEIWHMRCGGQPADGPDDGAVSDPRLFAGAALIFAWLVGFALAIWIIGFYPAALAFLFLYIRFKARLSSLASALWATGATAAVFLLFNMLLNVSPYTGLIGGFPEL